METSSNPFAALLGSNTPSKNNDIQKQDTDCETIERVFGFTLDKKRSLAKKLVYLEELSSTFAGRNLDLEVLEHALFERLFLTSPKDFVLNFDETVDEDIYEEKVMVYLFKCYKKIFEIEKKDKFRENLIDLVMRNGLVSLKQSDLYANQDVYMQFYEILRECSAVSDDFFNSIHKSFIEDEGKYIFIYINLYFCGY